MFRYTVTEQDYLQMAKWLLVKQRGPKKTAVPRLLLKTVLQMGVVAWLVLSYGEEIGAMKWFLIAASLLYASLAIYRYFFLNVRANKLLAQAKQESGAADFWREHRLEVKGEKLHLSYGNVNTDTPCRDITEVENWEDLELILRGREVFEAVPKNVTKSDRWQSFKTQLLSIRDREQARAWEELEKTLLTKSDFHAYIRMSREEFADKVVQMKRRSLLYPAGWTFLTFFAFLFPLIVAVFSAYGGAWQTFAFSIIIFFILNWYLISLFLPSYRRKVREQVLPPGEKGYLVAVREKTIYLLTERNAVEYPMQSLRRSARSAGDLFLYFKQQQMLCIPAEYADAFLRALKGEKSLKERAGGRY